MTEVHSPAPWRQYEDDPLIIVDRDGASLGEMVPGDPYTSRKSALANARLIAAAPELLAALVALADNIAALDDEGLAEHADQMRAARAAIAKVEGAE